MKFSEKMEAIEKVVARLEKEPLPLEESLSLFEQGVALINDCLTYLDEATQRVSVLLSDGGDEPLPEEDE